jgi:hypothetical protein
VAPAIVDVGQISQKEFRINFTNFTLAGTATVQNGEVANDGQLNERTVFMIA